MERTWLEAVDLMIDQQKAPVVDQHTQSFSQPVSIDQSVSITFLALALKSDPLLLRR